MKSFMDSIIRNSDNYRGLPFWSWNDKLETETLKQQIREMKKVGLGGFFMHARSGLETEYLSGEWFECINVCIQEARIQNMQAWCYDEEGWPSGFASGQVIRKSADNCMKWLEISDQKPLNGKDIIAIYKPDWSMVENTENTEGEVFYIFIDKNQYYVDILDKETVYDFLNCTHEKYFEKFAKDFGGTLPGFFTDEPQFALGKKPWSRYFAEIFRENYGYDIKKFLPCLFYDISGYEKIRHHYWCLVSKLYCESFGRQIYDWCKEHNCKLTGHVMCENDLKGQMYSTGGAMPFYEYMDMPGMDWLGRSIGSPLIPKQVSSVAAQLGKKKAISETFALCGWNVSFEELKWIAQWQFVNGINVICAHLESYSLRGFRKRDYPPSLFIQQPWWEKYRSFNDYFARLGALLGAGKDNCTVLLLHPIQSAYIVYGDDIKIDNLDSSFEETLCLLSDNHIEFHLGDETLIKKYGKVKQNQISIAEKSYSTVVLPNLINLSKFTYDLLIEFANNGGMLYSNGSLPYLIEGQKTDKINVLYDYIEKLEVDKIRNISVCENNRECSSIHITSRTFENKKVLFLVNLDKSASHSVDITIKNINKYSQLDLMDMTLKVISKNDKKDNKIHLHFEPTQDYLLIEDNEVMQEKSKIEYLYANNIWSLQSMTENSLVLDICDYKIDEQKWVENTAVIILQRILLERKEACNIKIKFFVNFEVEPQSLSDLFLAVEYSEEYNITINGHKVQINKATWWRDSSFKKVQAKEYFKKGTNEIIIEGEFYQSKKVYDILYGKDILETELNKLTYNTELESIYLVGDFGIYSNSEFKELNHNAIATEGGFVVKSKPCEFIDGDFTIQGLCFFSGRVTLYSKKNIKVTDNTKYIYRIKKPNAVVSELIVNGKKAKTLAWEPYEADITTYIKNGENEIELILYSGNRNLLGPHHFINGESYMVGPSTFTDKPGWCDAEKSGSIWNGGYCFTKFGL